MHARLKTWDGYPVLGQLFVMTGFPFLRPLITAALLTMHKEHQIGP
jgi:hypothetical protein